MGLELLDLLADVVSFVDHGLCGGLRLGRVVGEQLAGHRAGDQIDPAPDVAERRHLRIVIADDLLERGVDGRELEQRQATHADDQCGQRAEPEREPGGDFHVVDFH